MVIPTKSGRIVVYGDFQMKTHNRSARYRRVIVLIYLFIASIWAYALSTEPGYAPARYQTGVTSAIRRQFRGLKTNLFKRSIDLTRVFDGGPGKDGIPAIRDPQFVVVERAKTKPSEWGVLVSILGKHRFYPKSILVWHEIVNDSMAGKEYAVTFCPLCGSAIVFDRKVGGETLFFGVSGKLYESNLLMYDDKTESLWSQSMGEAVVGDYTGTKLNLVRMQLLTFLDVQNGYPGAQILSEKTGYRRDYGRYPYGDYEKADTLYFPVKVQDKKFFAKEMMYVFEVEGKSVAFPVKDLDKTLVTKIILGKTVSVERNGNAIDVFLNDEVVPGYYEMWFSWVTHNKKSGIVWDIKD